MAKTDNLTDFLTDLADTIRAKKGTTAPINPQDFSSEINSIETSGGEYNIESVLNDDGTQTLNITHKDYAPPKYDRVFANNTPEQIDFVSKEIAQQGLTSAQVADVYGWQIGDVKDITLTSGEAIQVRIIGVNHDELSNGTGKAGLTLEMVDCLATKYRINMFNANDGGYPASELKTSTLPTIYELMPPEWQNVIKLVNKKSANGGSSNFTGVVTTSENLFILSEYEVFSGSGYYSQNGKDEGVQYEYWKGKSVENRVKKHDANGDGVVDTPVIWWLRSCYKGGTLYFCQVYSSGGSNYSGASDKCGISFAFCI